MRPGNVPGEGRGCGEGGREAPFSWLRPDFLGNNGHRCGEEGQGRADREQHLLPGPGFPVEDFELLPPWVVTPVSPGPGGPRHGPLCTQTPRQAQRIRGPRPEAPQLSGLGTWSPLSSFLGKACLTLLSQGGDPPGRSSLLMEGASQPCLCGSPWVRGEQGLPTPGGTEGSGTRIEGWSEGSVPSHRPSLDRLPAPSPPTLPISSGAFVSPGRRERR